MRVLILGGTAEARELASRLVAAEVEVTSSLAGRVSSPRLPVGDVRSGGFGGVSGLAHALKVGGFTHLVDATHPFASTMTQHAVLAARRARLPLLRLARPGWADRPDAAGWHWASSVEHAAQIAAGLGQRPFIATGRQTLGTYTAWHGLSVLVRVVEPLADAAPQTWTVVKDRGPYSYEGELELFRLHRVDVLLTKDSGGSYTSAKLDVARDLRVPVVVVQRPSAPAGLREVAAVSEVLTWLGQGPR